MSKKNTSTRPARTDIPPERYPAGELPQGRPISWGCPTSDSQSEGQSRGARITPRPASLSHFNGQKEPVNTGLSRLSHIPGNEVRERVPPSSGPHAAPHTSEEAGQVSHQGLADALGAVQAFVARFVALTREQRLTVALWVLHCWLVEASECSPLLVLTSAVRQSGKSRLLEVLNVLVPNAWLTTHTTVAALVRTLKAEHVVLLLDEADHVFKGNADFVHALTAVLNGGHRRGQRVRLCIRDGQDWKPESFELYGPKCVAGIDLTAMPDTVLDRAIIIEMARCGDATVERWRTREITPAADAIQKQLRTLAGDSFLIAELRAARPDLPSVLSDRAHDIWEPLFAIADAAGCGKRARDAAVSLRLEATDPAHDGDIKVQLLHDVNATFAASSASAMPTSDVLAALLSDAERPWCTITKGQPLTQHMLAKMLRQFKIQPQQVRLLGQRFRGYVRAEIEAAARYLRS